MNAYDMLPKKKKRTKYPINLNTVLVLIAILAATAVLGFRQLGRLSPGEVTLLWNTALYDGDVELAGRYTSETSVNYINDYFGSLTAFAERYDDANRGTSRLIEEQVKGDAALVLYLICYADNTQEERRNILHFEDGTWKVAPQYGDVHPVTGATC